MDRILNLIGFACALATVALIGVGLLTTLPQ